MWCVQIKGLSFVLNCLCFIIMGNKHISWEAAVTVSKWKSRVLKSVKRPGRRAVSMNGIPLESATKHWKHRFFTLAQRFRLHAANMHTEEGMPRKQVSRNANTFPKYAVLFFSEIFQVHCLRIKGTWEKQWIEEEEKKEHKRHLVI